MKANMRTFFTLTITLFLYAFQQANAGTFTVINTNDAGTGSLRQARVEMHPIQ